MSFQFTHFLKESHSSIDNQEKKCYAQLSNFSSNELLHSQLNDLTQRFFADNVAEIARCYPYLLTARHEIATHYKITAEEILLAPGSDFAINLLLMAMKTQQSIVLLDPEYYSYARYAKLNDFSIVRAKLDFLNFNHDFPAYDNQLNNLDPAIVVLSNPSGITGLKLNLDEVKRIAECCYRNNHLLIIDEAYSAFEAIDHTAFLRNFDNIIILKSFSKSHGIAGLRFASVFTNKKIIDYLRKTGLENAVSGISIAYFLFLLQNDDFIKKIHRDIMFSKKQFNKFINNVFPTWILFPTATHFITIDTRNELLAQAIVGFLSSNKIAIKNLDNVSELKTCIRITIAESQYMQPIMVLLQEFKDNQRQYFLDCNR